MSIFYLIEEEAQTIDACKRAGFTKVSFKDIGVSAAEQLQAIEADIKGIEATRAEIDAALAALQSQKADIRYLHDALIIKRDKVKIKNRLLKTKESFYFDGYVPADKSAAVRAAAEEAGCLVTLEAVEKGEEHPVQIKNSKISEPFEAITFPYSTPSPRSIDPTPFLAPFYMLFFGMMLSDAGYGLIIAIGCFVLLRKFRLEGMAKRMISMLMLSGVATIVWGVLFGGYFGDIIEVVARTMFGVELDVPPLWFDPIGDPMRLLMVSFIFGGIHLFLGMGLKAYQLIRDGDWVAAVCDIGMWYLTLVGLVLYFLGTPWALYMLLAGVGGLILTQGRAEKNIFMKLFKGVSSLYNITAYLSDVLSYSRLLALGLATGVIASVINTMGSLGGPGVVGAIVLLVVFVAGTVLNLAINTLGTFVHTSRLQYVEFFGKFFEGGGKAFEPFERNTNYIHIDSKEEA